MGIRVAVAGAAGTIGREIVKTLAERAFPAERVVALGSGRAVGGSLSYGEQNLRVESLDRHELGGTDLLFIASGTPAAASLAGRAAAAGALVVDTTGSAPATPIVPEVNPGAIGAALEDRILASPGPGAILVAMALKPLHDLAGLTRIVAVTYQPVSSVGRAAMDELFAQTRAVYVNESPPPEEFPKPIAFNLFPQVGAFNEDGTTEEEAALTEELEELLGAPTIATCVRVPVFIGQAVAIHAAFARPIEEAEAREALREAPGLTLLDRRDDGGYITPIETAGEDPVFVSRLRRDPTVPNGLALWCAADNLRKGGALNAVQIAEELVRRGALAP
ncbi:aspartate-semialdehyde dehydrogenase [Muricoccus radiodurans]|uniref:aspartate-semialdehyde dehydrogenase n=1 Tax=Muricoccus radiodurans TaxID=2231721 RepID=UPI003CF4E3D2